jgi:hypothetical protein
MDLQLNDPVVYEFVGIDGKRRQLVGRITDLFEAAGQRYADVLIGRQVSPEPIRLELLRPARPDDQQEARHVLC